MSYTLSLVGNTAPLEANKDYIQSSPAYQWEEISVTGTRLNVVSEADDATQLIPITGFGFPYFGRSMSSVFVSSNGILTFDSAYDDKENWSVPGKDAPPNIIAPYWLDLRPDSAGDVYYKQESDRLIVQYQAVRSYSGSSTYTFQVILFSNGNIEFRYKAMGATNAVAIGIQDGSKVLGVNVFAVGLFSNGPRAFAWLG